MDIHVRQPRTKKAPVTRRRLREHPGTALPLPLWALWSGLLMLTVRAPYRINARSQCSIF